jgi:prefoldin subunit 5
MCAVKYSEFKYNTIESKINSLFNSVNQLNESIILLYKKINTLDNVNKEVQTTVLTSMANTDSD